MPVTNIDEDVKDQALSIIVGGDIHWYNHLGKQFGIMAYDLKHMG